MDFVVLAKMERGARVTLQVAFLLLSGALKNLMELDFERQSESGRTVQWSTHRVWLWRLLKAKKVRACMNDFMILFFFKRQRKLVDYVNLSALVERSHHTKNMRLLQLIFICFQILSAFAHFVLPFGFPGYFDPRVGYFQLVRYPAGFQQWREVYFPGATKKLPKLKSLGETAKDLGTFNELLGFVDKVGFTETLEDSNCKTVLAPPDDIFNQLPPGALDGLIESGEGAEILVKHVIPECIPSDDIESGPIATAGGELIEFIKQADGKLQIKSGSGTYNVTSTDTQASNGIIHVVDGIFV